MVSEDASAADLLLTNGRVWTADAKHPWADTVLIRGDRLVFVGRADDWHGEVAERVDLGGRVVLPGLIDAHTHPGSVAKSRWHVALPWTDDLDEILRFIREYGASHPASETPFIYFEYYPSSLFADSPPTARMLDQAISDRPVLCQDFSEHSCWVNSKMLELMGVDASTPDPVPGLEMFARAADGAPTGHLYEGVWHHFAHTLWSSIGWQPPEEVTVDNLEPVLAYLRDHGVTAVFDAVLEGEAALRTVAELDARGSLNMHYQAALRFRSLQDLPATLTTAQSLQSRYGNDHIRVRAVKLFLDGTNESGNSAVLEPLVSDACARNRGAIQMPVQELVQCLALCNDADIDLHIHMVGDRAFRTACDAVATAQDDARAAGQPWRTQVTFAHCELVDPADMHRPVRLGIIVNWTTHWSAGYFGEEARQHLGDERWERMYEFNSIAESGATLTFSSDVVTQYELHRADPFFGMQIAATRVDPEYPLDPGRYPGSVRPNPTATLSLERLLKGYTSDGAAQLRLADDIGTIAVGKAANLVVLNDDLFAAEPSQFGAVRPETVIFEGAVVSGSL